MPIRRLKEIADQRRLRQMRGKKEALRLAPRSITIVTEKMVHSWQYLQFRLFLKLAIFGQIDVDGKGDFEFWRNLFEIDTFQQEMPCVLFYRRQMLQTLKRQNVESLMTRETGGLLLRTSELDKFVVRHVF